MKKITMLITATIAVLWLYGQNTMEIIDTGNITRERWRDSLFRIDKSQVPTGFLLEYSMSGLESSKFDGTGNNDDTLKQDGEVFGLHDILWYSKVNNNATIAETDSLYGKAFLDNLNSDVIPLTFIYQPYNRIRQTALSEGLFTIHADSVGLLDVPGRPASPYDPYELFAFAPFKTNIVRYNAIPFTLPNQLFYVNGFNSIEVDFGDGAGFRTLNKGGSINIYYATEGTKYLTAKLTTVNGVRLAKCQINYKRPAYYYAPDFSWNIEADPVYTSESEYLGSSKLLDDPVISCNEGSFIERLLCGLKPNARVRVINGCDAVFDRPIIIVEGFDPDKQMSFDDKIERFQSFNFMETMRGYGFDFVFVFFTRNNTFIENNAAVLEAVINKVNLEKTGTNPNTVIGFSMGGLIARWCLRDMENRNVDHEVANYFSYDAPHQGANIPLGMQYIFKEVVRDVPYAKWFSKSLRNLNDAFSSPAAKQMMVTYGSYNNGPFNWFPNLYTLDPLRAAFAERLVAMGYPQLTNNYGLAFGRGDNTANTKDAGVGQQFTPANPFDPQDNIFSGAMSFLLINMNAEANAVPENNTKATIAYYSFFGVTIRRIFGIPILPTITLRVRRFDYRGQYPYDDAMGSFEQTQTEFVDSWWGGIMGIGGPSSTTNGHDGHNFVATASALDLQNQGYGAGTNWQSNNMFFNIDNEILNPGTVAGNTLSVPARSPFDAVLTGTSDCGSVVCTAQAYRDENGNAVFPPNEDTWNHLHNMFITRQAARFIQRKILNALPVNCAGSDGLCNRNPSISGPGVLCTTGVYTINNLPAGVTILWLSVNGTFNVIGGQGTPTATIQRVFNGLDIVRVQFTNACGASITRDLNIISGFPMAEFVSFGNGIEQEGFWCTSHNGNTFTISPVDLTGVGYDFRLLSWPSLSVVYTGFTQYGAGGPYPFGSNFSPGWYVFEIRPNTICGTGDWIGFEVEFVDCSLMKGSNKYFTIFASPNPASSDLYVRIDHEKPEVKELSKNEQVRYVLTDMNRASVVKQWTFTNGQNVQRLDVRGIRHGQYVLTVMKGKYKESVKIVIE